MVDSGSCFDIVGKLSLSDSDQSRIRHSKNGVILQTANGMINETRTVDISVDCIDKTIGAVVLDQCPNKMSLGHQCMIEGYSFRWDAGQNPVITLDGREIILELEWLVPVLPVISGACGTEEFEAAQAAVEPPPPLPPPSGTGALTGTIAREKPPSTHELTHFPKLSTCKICCEAKSHRAPCHKKRESAEAEEEDMVVPLKFGDLITADHAIMKNPEEMSARGDMTTLVVMDRFTHWLSSYPSPINDADSTELALKHFMGGSKVRRAYTDGSGELAVACKSLKITHDVATPHRPQPNGVAERAVRRVLEGTRAILHASGLPHR